MAASVITASTSDGTTVIVDDPSSFVNAVAADPELWFNLLKNAMRARRWYGGFEDGRFQGK